MKMEIPMSPEMCRNGMCDKRVSDKRIGSVLVDLPAQEHMRSGGELGTDLASSKQPDRYDRDRIGKFYRMVEQESSPL